MIRTLKYKPDTHIINTILAVLWKKLQELKPSETAQIHHTGFGLETIFNYSDRGNPIPDQVCKAIIKEQIEHTIKVRRTCIALYQPEYYLFGIYDGEPTENDFINLKQLQLMQTDIKLYMAL